MTTKGRFAAVVNQEFSAVLHETFQLFPSLGRDLFPSLSHVRIGKLFHLAERLLIFFTSSRMKVSIAGEEKCSLDKAREGDEVRVHERVRDTNLCKSAKGDICCSIRALVKNGEVIYSLTR